MSSYGNNNNSSSGGIGITTVLTIVFIVLKFCKVINWSWIWVLCPIWISLLLWLIVLIILLIVKAILNSHKKRGKRVKW